MRKNPVICTKFGKGERTRERVDVAQVAKDTVDRFFVCRYFDRWQTICGSLRDPYVVATKKATLANERFEH